MSSAQMDLGGLPGPAAAPADQSTCVSDSRYRDNLLSKGRNCRGLGLIRERHVAEVHAARSERKSEWEGLTTGVLSDTAWRAEDVAVKRCRFVYPKAKSDCEELRKPKHVKSTLKVSDLHSNSKQSDPAYSLADADPKVTQTIGILASAAKPCHSSDTFREDMDAGEAVEEVIVPEREIVVDSKSQDEGLQIVDLLLDCAKEIERGNAESALQTLRKLQAKTTIKGTCMQRLGVYFSEAIAARLRLHDWEHVRPGMDMKIYQGRQNVRAMQEMLKSFITVNKLWPVEQFAHFCTNQAIMEAVERHERIHVVDINITRGFQWPSLMQSLATRRPGAPSLRITGIGPESETLNRTGARLAKFAGSCGLLFKFEGVQADDEQLEDIILDKCVPTSDEAIIVNCVLHLHRLLGDSGNARLVRLLRGLRRRGPTLITLVEREASLNSAGFTPRFVEALQHYAAVLDAMSEGATLGGVTDGERIEAEAVYIAAEVRNIVACEGDDRVQRHERSASWGQRMEAAGLRMAKWSWMAAKQADLLLGEQWASHGYRVSHVKGGFLALQWRDIVFVTASAWKCPGSAPFHDVPIGAMVTPTSNRYHAV